MPAYFSVASVSHLLIPTLLVSGYREWYDFRVRANCRYGDVVIPDVNATLHVRDHDSNSRGLDMNLDERVGTDQADGLGYMKVKGSAADNDHILDPSNAPEPYIVVDFACPHGCNKLQYYASDEFGNSKVGAGGGSAVNPKKYDFVAEINCSASWPSTSLPHWPSTFSPHSNSSLALTTETGESSKASPTRFSRRDLIIAVAATATLVATCMAILFWIWKFRKRNSKTSTSAVTDDSGKQADKVLAVEIVEAPADCSIVVGTNTLDDVSAINTDLSHYFRSQDRQSGSTTGASTATRKAELLLTSVEGLMVLTSSMWPETQSKVDKYENSRLPWNGNGSKAMSVDTIETNVDVSGYKECYDFRVRAYCRYGDVVILDMNATLHVRDYDTDKGLNMNLDERVGSNQTDSRGYMKVKGCAKDNDNPFDIWNAPEPYIVVDFACPHGCNKQQYYSSDEFGNSKVGAGGGSAVNPKKYDFVAEINCSASWPSTSLPHWPSTFSPHSNSSLALTTETGESSKASPTRFSRRDLIIAVAATATLVATCMAILFWIWKFRKRNSKTSTSAVTDDSGKQADKVLAVEIVEAPADCSIVVGTNTLDDVSAINTDLSHYFRSQDRQSGSTTGASTATKKAELLLTSVEGRMVLTSSMWPETQSKVDKYENSRLPWNGNCSKAMSVDTIETNVDGKLFAAVGQAKERTLD